jgi:NAD(P)-dependent dehydrogenase (short-subunit alcohol dehydrogenase family)
MAFVTGAGAGIGRGIALRLSADGTTVIVTDKDLSWAENTRDEIEKRGGKATALRLDVTDSKDVNEVVEAVWTRFGQIDILVNNAGVSSMGRLVDLTESDWDRIMDVNAKGVFLVTVTVLRKMVNHDYGSEPPKIVNVASMGGKIAVPFLAHYIASKFAVVGFTKATALELAPLKINVNCVCPGIVDTSMLEREIEWEANFRKMTREEMRKAYLSQVPLGRLATPEDVAKIVAFLCSREADYMTGQAINVTGGLLMF